MNTNEVPIQTLRASAYTVPTDAHEADGTIEWDSTTLVLVELEAGGEKGLGYTYAHVSTVQIIEKTLKKLVLGKNIMELPLITFSMVKSIRNEGSCGIAMMAVSAVDNALWDLKAKVLGISLSFLLGNIRNKVLIYGSGGFTSYSNEQLEKQLGTWADMGISHIKMKVGSHIEKDLERVQIARNAIGKDTELYIDANGAYTVNQALEMAYKFSTCNVTWLEEPVVSDNLKGLNFIRNHAPIGMKVAAGEYGYNPFYFQNMLEEEAVDVLQADATRCGGISGFMNAGALAFAYQVPFSSHCAPAMHLHAAIASPAFFIAEYFHDHVRIENIFLDGIPSPVNGYLLPDLSRPGVGFDFKYSDAAPYKVA